MSYKIIPTPDFKRVFKKLAKKYQSLPQDLQNLAEELRVEPTKGTNIGTNTFKIRLQISSKNKGKSAGARIITYVVTADKEIYLVYIYDKSKISSITKKQINQLLDAVGLI